MPTFPTPEPIVATVDIIGDLRTTASDRSDTVVVVRPGDSSKPGDVRAAEQTTVELTDGRLVVRSPRSWRQWSPFGGYETVDVTIELPTGSQVTADTALGNLATDGELGEVRLKSAMGSIRVDESSGLRATTGYGNVTVEHVAGDAEVSSGSGDVRVDHIGGTAVLKSGNGDITVGEVLGELRTKASNGDITVGRAHASAVAKTANGAVRIAEVSRGTIVVESAAGELEVGIHEGTAVWLDLDTSFGKVRNQLDGADGPPSSDRKVEVRARTSIGDIIVGRSAAAPTPDESDAP